MKTNFTLSIPNPCSENWNTFTPTATGGFCGSCQKNVIDFTKASDDEIIAFIKQNSGPACGRFRSSQLKTFDILPEIRIRPGFTLLKAGVLSLLLLLMTKQASAQLAADKPLIEIIHSSKNNGQAKNNDRIIISGTIISSEDKSPLSGVSILQKGTINGTLSDENGIFELTLDLRDGQVLTASFIGMITKEVTLPEAAEIRLSIALDSDITSFAGELVITGDVGTEKLYSEQPSGLKRFWNRIKNLF